MQDKLQRPDWIRVKAPISKTYHDTRDLIHSAKLNTVCEEAACPNIGECWSQKHATYPPGPPPTTTNSYLSSILSHS